MLKEHFVIVVARVSHFSEDFKGLVVNHIPHPYTSEMAKKSKVVSCYKTIDFICMH